MEQVDSVEIIHMDELAKQNFGKDIFVDTKPLFLFLSGSYNINSLESEFSEKDFYFLQAFLAQFAKIVITPQVLAEVSNLANTRIGKKYFSDFIKSNVKIILNMDEHYVPKNEFIQKAETYRVGVTDSSIISCCKEFNLLLLTNDSPLERICYEQTLPVLNFTKLRAAVGLLS